MTIYVAHRLKKNLWAFLLLMLWCHASKAQHDSIKPTKQQNRVTLVTAAVYGTALVGLHQLWYKDYERYSFHFFNDGNEWLQMDKAGHFGSVYYLSKFNSKLYSAYGIGNKKSVWMGTVSAMTFLTAIEVMDGYSAGWGFSTGDVVANTAGALLFAGQQLAWNETRVDVKFSFAPSPYAQCRPTLLGNNHVQQLFKDYNGQTYWLSATISDFLKPETKFPPWLSIAFGYGATGMTGAGQNVTNEACMIDNNQRQREFYLAPDINLSKIKTNKKWLRTAFTILSFIKIPTPAIALQKNKFRVLPIKF